MRFLEDPVQRQQLVDAIDATLAQFDAGMKQLAERVRHWPSAGRFADGGGPVSAGLQRLAPDVSVTVAELADGESSSVQSRGGLGARLTRATVRTECGQRVQKGDVLTANLAPAMSGSWRHTDCSDPKLEQSDG